MSEDGEKQSLSVLKEKRDSERIKCVVWDVGTNWKFLFLFVSVTKGGLCTSGSIGKSVVLWLDSYKLATC